jgi:tape measure domain-containing protein
VWENLNKEILQAERGITNIQKRQQLGPTAQQRLGAAGGAFLYGGGLGGGAGSALGGVTGGLLGGVPGAFTGAAIGQFADDIGMLTGQITEQAAVIKKLQFGLAGASSSLQDYAFANQEVERISNRLLIPIDEVTKKFTQLKASTIALGIDTKTTGEIFEGATAAVLRSGGNMDDVSGAMRAVVQVFSKGKLTAEELRGQLAERLPGAVVEFARISGKSLQQIDAEFEAGEATLDDFVKFLKSKKDDTNDYVGEMATSSEFAGARMQKAFERLRIGIGNTLQPAGAAIQDFVTRSINGLDKLIRKAVELKLVQPGVDFLALEAMAGKDGGVAGAEQRLLQLSSIEEETRGLARRAGLGFMENLLPDVSQVTADVKKQEEVLQRIRRIQKLIREDARLAQDEEKKAKKDQAAASYLGAIEKREEALAQAKQQYEEDIAEARKKAVKQVEELERKNKDSRIAAEREIARARRDLQAATSEEGLLRRTLNTPVTGERQDIIDAEREASRIVREYTEDKISREQESQDRQIKISRELEDFKKVNSDAINKAGERYARKTGEIQQTYAKTVAKLIEDGSGNGAKRLASAGKAIAAMIAKASAQQAFTAAAGAPIIPRGNGRYEIAGEEYTQSELTEVIDAQRKKTDPTQKAIGGALEAYIMADKAAIESSKDLGVQLGARATVQTPSIAPVSTADLDARVAASGQSLSQSNAKLDNATNKLSEQKQIVNSFLGAFVEQGQATRRQSEELDKQLTLNIAQRDLLKQGVLPSMLQQVTEAENLYDIQRQQLLASGLGATKQASLIENAADRKRVEEEIEKLYQEQLKTITASEEAYLRLRETAMNTEAALEADKIRAGGQLIGGGLRAGFIGESARAYESAIEKGFSKQQASEIANATQEVKYLKLASEGLEDAISGAGDAFGNAFKGIVTGSMTAREALAGFFQSLADSFADMVSKMIAEYMKMALIKGIMSLIPGLGAVAGGLGGGLSGGLSSGFSAGSASAIDTGAAGWGAAFNTPLKFANGGIASGGFRAFANGGIVTGPTLGLVGEGRYNEAVIPLPDGKSVPVDLGGAMGGNITSNIVVNVSSDGKVSSAGGGADAAGFGRKLEGAVKQVIVGELRPGGLLSRRN